MKILYAIQGTGNGHLSRARDIIPCLQQRGEVDILVSGVQADVSLPYNVDYQLRGWSFIFGKKGGVDLTQTMRNTHLRRLYREISQLPVEKYDLVVNDFEPVSAWACRRKEVPCVGLSHQSAVAHPASPKPKKRDLKGEVVLRRYAPVSKAYGFHFEPYADNIYTPVIRNEIRRLNPTAGNHYTVYLPAYSDKRIIKVLGQIKQVRWEVFSKHTKESYYAGNVWVRPVNNEAFLQSFASCEGIICGAGFEAPAEALYLNKKVLVVPMKSQYEQQCNAAAIKELGVPVIKKFKKKSLYKLLDWIETESRVEVFYPDRTQEITDRVIDESLAYHPPVFTGEAI